MKLDAKRTCEDDKTKDRQKRLMEGQTERDRESNNKKKQREGDSGGDRCVRLGLETYIDGPHAPKRWTDNDE